MVFVQASEHTCDCGCILSHMVCIRSHKAAHARIWSNMVAPATAYMAMVAGFINSVMPPARAPPAMPSSSALRATPTATKLLLHAVSIAMLGPFRPYR